MNKRWPKVAAIFDKILLEHEECLNSWKRANDWHIRNWSNVQKEFAPNETPQGQRNMQKLETGKAYSTVEGLKGYVLVQDKGLFFGYIDQDGKGNKIAATAWREDGKNALPAFDLVIPKPDPIVIYVRDDEIWEKGIPSAVQIYPSVEAARYQGKVMMPYSGKIRKFVEASEGVEMELMIANLKEAAEA
jgi:hypothetical protein